MKPPDLGDDPHDNTIYSVEADLLPLVRTNSVHSGADRAEAIF